MKDYTYYNDRMNAATEERLIEINRRFYEEHGRDFSETRQRLQPGVVSILDSLRGHEAILDLGSGNGELVRELARRGHRGSYLGLDFSPPLLEEARARRPESFSFPVAFRASDLTNLTLAEGRGSLAPSRWSVVTAFAVLHHIPGRERRLELLRGVHRWLQPDGLFIHSNWQFLTNPRMQGRIQTWDTVGLTQRDVAANDYLLDWRYGGLGLRYVHQFDETELDELAQASGFVMLDSFYSDGADRKSGLYQRWKRV